jgi:hypothetical protein
LGSLLSTAVTRRCLMPVGFVILAFFAGGFFGAIAMALACAAHDADEFFESMRDAAPVVPLPMAHPSKSH